ncbi:MAG: hypothetical protein EOM87_09425, partial [Clostridia bacterium]|nr:hypothetical protein [Clostridia bacterium]
MKKTITFVLLLALLVILAVSAAGCMPIANTLTFVVDGDVYYSLSYNLVTGIQLPPNPTKAGSEFEGWYWDKDVWLKPFNVQSLLTVPLSGAMVVYGKWKGEGDPVSYSITFDSNGGSAAASISAIENQSIFAPVPPTRTGYTFIGWYTDSALNHSFVFGTMPAESFTLYAKWEEETELQGLRALWANSADIFMELWQSFEEVDDAPIFIDADMLFSYDEIEYWGIANLLIFADIPMAFECDLLKTADFVNYLNATYSIYDEVPEFVQLDEKNIVCLDVFSVIEIFSNNLIYNSEHNSYYTSDYKKIVRYLGDDQEFCIPYGVETIGYYAFVDSIVEEVIIPDSVTKIGIGAFSYCDELNSIVLPNNITAIAHNTFYGCDMLTSISIPINVTLIESSAFSNSGLTAIYIPNNVISIASMAFSGCNSLSSVLFSEESQLIT